MKKEEFWDDTGQRVQLPGTPGDESAEQNATPPTPHGFAVQIAPDQIHYVFRIQDDFIPPKRKRLSEYRVYFAPASLLANVEDIKDPATAIRIFAAGTLAGSTSVGSKPGWIELESARRWVGLDGWFFCVTVNLIGAESDPTPPVRSPFNLSPADSTVPPDPEAVQATIFPEWVDGRTYARVVVTALVPTPLGSFAGYQIYLQNYRFNSLIEEGPFIGLSAQTPGQQLTGSFLLQPDVPAPVNLGTIRVLTGNPNINGTGTSWDPSWSSERRIEFYQPEVGGGDTPVLWYGNLVSVANPTALSFDAPGAYLPGAGIPYAIYKRDDYDAAYYFQSTQLPYYSHPVTLYFVAVSRSGTRRPDPENAPFVTFPFGIGAALTRPLNPFALSAQFNSGTSVSSIGASVALLWKTVSVSGGSGPIDSSLEHFNIRRTRVGTVGTPTWPPKSAATYATYKVDQALTNNGFYAWQDRLFNSDPTVAATTTDTGWDFDPVDPAQYVYYVTSVNVQGTENPLAFWGHVACLNGLDTITNIGGDPFTPDFDGLTIVIAGSDYTVTRYVSSTSIVVDPPFVAADGSYDYMVGPVTGRVTLMGLTGAEGDPTIYRDNFYNRLFNAQLIGTPTSALQVTGSAYGPADFAADGQPTYKYFFTSGEYLADDTTGALPGIDGSWALTAATYPVTDVDADNDKWSIWESFTAATSADPVFTEAGELEFDPTGHTTDDDFCGGAQLVAKEKFLSGENLVFQFQMKALGAITGSTGLIKVQGMRYDGRNFGDPTFVVESGTGLTNGVERDVGAQLVEASFNVGILTTDYQQIVVKLKLPTDDVHTVGTVLGGDLSTFITGSPIKLGEQHIGCYISLGWNMTPRQIISITGGADKFHRVFFGMDSPATALAGTATVYVQGDPGFADSAFTHYIFKISIVGPCNQLVRMKQPMVNGGLLGAPWRPDMSHLDWPGGNDQSGGGGLDPAVGCVLPGTMIETPDGPRPIELLVPGSKVRSYLGGRVVTNTVERLNKRMTGRLLKIVTNARDFMCSDTHLVGMAGERVTYEAASKIGLGALVYAYESGQVTIEEVRGIVDLEVPPTGVYSLTLTGPPRNYFAGQVLTHNKPHVIEQN